MRVHGQTVRGRTAHGRVHARSARGLTLVELLAVLTITAVLATIAVPSFGSLRHTAGVSVAANELLVALHFARTSAVLHAVPVTLCLSADEATCIGSAASPANGWLVFEQPDATVAPRTAVVPPVLRSFRAPGDIALYGSRTAVTFWPATRAGTTSTFDVCDVSGATRGRAIVVSQTGRPRVAAEEASCAP